MEQPSLDLVVALAIAGLAWLGLAALLLRAPHPGVRDQLAGSRGRALLGIGIGLTVGIGLLVARTDVIPDALEPSLVPLLLGITVAFMALVGWVAWSVGRS